MLEHFQDQLFEQQRTCMLVFVDPISRKMFLRRKWPTIYYCHWAVIDAPNNHEFEKIVATKKSHFQFQQYAIIIHKLYPDYIGHFVSEREGTFIVFRWNVMFYKRTIDTSDFQLVTFGITSAEILFRFIRNSPVYRLSLESGISFAKNSWTT